MLFVTHSERLFYLFLIVWVCVFVLNERNGLLITYQGSLLWSDLTLLGSLPFITLERAQQFLRWDLITLIACGGWEHWELGGRRGFLLMPMLTHQQNPSFTWWVWQQLLGQPMAPAPHQPLQVSTPTTAGIHTFPCRADGLGHWKET